ncbi:MAG: BtpA/SgcQ family protein [Bacteroidota bacterium]|nr:BtpA/SgcQ family protein [Bacteroidota bacterium]
MAGKNPRHSAVYPLIGMVHLLPLPGSPSFGGSMQEVIDRAVTDAGTLEEAGFDALLVENYGDAPFRKEAVDPVTIAAMARIVSEIRRVCRLPLGIQVLRNDAAAALSIAAVAGASFIRVNVHTGVMVTDQGIIEGGADRTLRLRAVLAPDVRIFADVLVKHARSPVPMDLASACRETVFRGRADAVIITGPETGIPPDTADIESARRAVDVPILAGSGANARNAALLLRYADGIIVGTAIKKGGVTTAPVDGRRAASFVREARTAMRRNATGTDPRRRSARAD